MNVSGSIGGRKDGEYNGVGFVEISQISVLLDIIFFGMDQFYGIRRALYIIGGQSSASLPRSTKIHTCRFKASSTICVKDIF